MEINGLVYCIILIMIPKVLKMRKYVNMAKYVYISW